MPAAKTSACRLYAILARDGRSAVVFRRGPSRRVALLRWWLGTDTVELGQWLNGRIYERRCDLSPDGALLVYFAAKWNTPLATWTAVSRPPFLHALALWPKGDAWGGGGLFETGRRLGLNHPPHQLATRDGDPPAKRLDVSRYADHAGGGEDNPIQHVRMVRDGWRLVAAGNASSYRQTGPARWILDEPEIYARDQPRRAGARARSGGRTLTLVRELRAVGVTQGPWYREDFIVRDGAGRVLRLIANCDWADWEASGDLLVAHGGALWRIPRSAVSDDAGDPLADARLVADLAPLRFEAIPPPPDARTWPSARSKPARGRTLDRPQRRRER